MIERGNNGWNFYRSRTNPAIWVNACYAPHSPRWSIWRGDSADSVQRVHDGIGTDALETALRQYCRAE